MAITKKFSGSFLLLFLLAITHISGKEACNPNDLYTDILWAPTSDCTVYCTNWCTDECVKTWASTMVKNKCTVANNSLYCDCCCKNNSPPPPPPPSPPPPPPSPPPCPSPPEPCSSCGCCNTDVNIQISVTQGGNVKLSTPSSSFAAVDSL
ncbi:hypothetical protein MKX01_011814 [Papaver californicum]|nr:hypothetical protein MKX01_011814 [Papaver californicum]